MVDARSRRVRRCRERPPFGESFRAPSCYQADGSGGDGERAARPVVRRARDIRDPKLAVIGDALFLYVLANDTFLAIPHETLVATSRDGRSWDAFRPVGPPGFLLWRPRTPDGVTWYVPAFATDGSSVRLLRSADGLAWEELSSIYEGGGASETDVAFATDGTLFALVRLEADDGLVAGSDRNATLVATARPPYLAWAATRVEGERLAQRQPRGYATVACRRPRISL